MDRRLLVLSLWITLVLVALYTYFFERHLLHGVARAFADAPPVWAYAGYAPRLHPRFHPGASHLPGYCRHAGPPADPLYLLTLPGSSSRRRRSITSPSDAVRSVLRKAIRQQMARLRALLTRRQLPIVVLWSFFPLAPTDLVCYACGALRVDLKNAPGGGAGEGAICAVYIFMGWQALAWMR